jgi:hypothetical protein
MYPCLVSSVLYLPNHLRDSDKRLSPSEDDYQVLLVNLSNPKIVWLATKLIGIKLQIKGHARVVPFVWIAIQELLDAPMDF